LKKAEKLKELKSVDEIPKKFKYDQEEVEFWDSHSFASISDEMPISNLIPRKRKRMRPISIRLPEDTIKDAMEISISENIDYTALLRQIVIEGINVVKKKKRETVNHVQNSEK
jgi:hypothetical protein